MDLPARVMSLYHSVSLRVRIAPVSLQGISGVERLTAGDEYGSMSDLTSVSLTLTLALTDLFVSNTHIASDRKSTDRVGAHECYRSVLVCILYLYFMCTCMCMRVYI